MNVTFDFKSFSMILLMILLRILMTLIFGSLFLFLIQSFCNENNVCGAMKIPSIEFAKIDLDSHTNTFRSFVFSYVLGFLLRSSGIWCFRLLRKFELESYVVKGWSFKKKRNVRPFDLKLDVFHHYLAEHPYMEGIHTLNHFVSMIPRPLLSVLISVTILSYPQERYVLLMMLSVIVLVIATGLSADKEANDSDESLYEDLVKDVTARRN